MNRLILLVVLCTGCELAPWDVGRPRARVTRSSFVEANATPTAKSLPSGSPYWSGWVDVAVVASTCDGYAVGDRFQVYGEAFVVGGRLSLRIQTYPQLEGPIAAGQAKLTGATTFMDGGESILCDVQGNADVGDDGLMGRLTEALTSASGQTCITTIDYMLDLP